MAKIEQNKSDTHTLVSGTENTTTEQRGYWSSTKASLLSRWIRFRIQRFALPATWAALGAHVYQNGTLRNLYRDQFAQLDGMHSQQEVLNLSFKAADGQASLLEKVRLAVTSLPQRIRIKLLQRKISRAFSQLGRLAYFEHRKTAGPKELILPIVQLRKRLKLIEQEIESKSQLRAGKWLTPQRVLMSAIVLLLLCGAGMLMIPDSTPGGGGGKVVVLPGGEPAPVPIPEEEITKEEQNQFAFNRIGKGMQRDLQQLQANALAKKMNQTKLQVLRRQFWQGFPQTQTNESLKQQYAEALLQKDLQLIYGGITTGSSGFMSQVYRVSLDGGVAPIARPLFDRWMKEIRKRLDIREVGKLQQLENLKAFNRTKLAEAIRATAPLAEQYVLLRDWNEYHSAGHQQDFYPSPQAYLAFLYQTDDEIRSQQQAILWYRQLARMLGEDELLAIADKQRLQSKMDSGQIIGSKMKPMYDLFERLAEASEGGFILNEFRMLSRSDDRLAEAIDEYQAMLTLLDAREVLAAAAKSRQIPGASLADFLIELEQESDRTCFLALAARQNGVQWKAAGKQYTALCEIYGEQAVHRAAHQVRTAKRWPCKADPRGNVFIEVPPTLRDAKRFQKIGFVTRNEALFELLVREPRKPKPEKVSPRKVVATFSSANQISTSQIPAEYSDGRLSVASGRLAVSVNGERSANILGGLFGPAPTQSYILLYEPTDTDKPLKIQGGEGAYGYALDLSDRYIAVGNRTAWLSNPRTGKGPRLNAGEAYLYDRQSGKLNTNVRPPRDSPMRGLQFGTAVALAGEFLAVGATGRRGHSEDEGEVDIFDIATGKFVYRIMLSSQDRDHGRLGANIASDGKNLIVTAPGNDKESRKNPGVFVHHAGTGRLLSRLERPAGDSRPYDFGISVAISGSQAIVGYPSHRDGGAVLVYEAESGKLLSILKVPGSDVNDDEWGAGKLVSLITDKTGRTFSLGRSVAMSDHLIAAASYRGVHLFDASSSKYLYSLLLDEELKASAERREIHRIGFDGTTLVVSTHNGSQQNWTHHRIDLSQFN